MDGERSPGGGMGICPRPPPFWEVFVPAIATDMNQNYYSTLRLKRLADILFPCHGPGFTEETKKFLDK